MFRNIGDIGGVQQPGPVNVFTYLDYRAALRDLYAHKKAHEYGFSHRAFSRRAGLRSTNFLKLVMDGKRNLSAEVALRFSGALGLRGAQSDFFCELVRYNQARSVNERAQAYDRLLRLRPERETNELAAHQAAYHAAWYMPAIRELAARADFCDDPRWIARTLTPSITVAKAKQALHTLEALGLLARNTEGVLKPVHALVTTGLTPQNHQLVKYHREMLERASEAMELFARDEREIASLTLCIDERVLPALKLRLQAFRRELMQYAEGSGEPERVVQVNFQMFPLSKGKERT